MTQQWAPDDRADLTDEEVREIAQRAFDFSREVSDIVKPGAVNPARLAALEEALEAVLAIPQMHPTREGRGWNFAVDRVQQVVNDVLRRHGQ